jgi:hypothetical protein
MNSQDIELLSGLLIVGNSTSIDPSFLTAEERLEAITNAVKESQTFTNCCLCFEEVPDDQLFLLPCQHGGCDSCMLLFFNSPLLENQEVKRCPMCRCDIDPAFLTLGDVVEEFAGLGLQSPPPRRGRRRNSSETAATRCQEARPRRSRRVVVSATEIVVAGPVEEAPPAAAPFVSPITRRYRARNASIQEARNNPDNNNDNLQDLYETMERDVIPLLKLIKQHMPQCFITDDNNSIFEPCCGNGAISNVFKILGYKVIERDLYTRTPAFNFLEDGAPEEHFDFLITNPPYNGKKNFFIRALSIGKPFAMFLPIDIMFMSDFNKLLDGQKVLVYAPTKKAMFLRDGKYKNVGNVVWLLVNFPFLTEGISFKYYTY